MSVRAPLSHSEGQESKAGAVACVCVCVRWWRRQVKGDGTHGVSVSFC